MNIDLLEQLRMADGRFLTLEQLGPNRAAIEADLAELADYGFGIGRDGSGGARYEGPSPRLCPDQIEHRLATRLIGRRIAVWERVGSTNDLALRAAGSRSNAGLVVLAERQSAGRGRRGRIWASPPRSAVLFSTLLFPPTGLAGVAWMTGLGAVASASVVEEATGRRSTIKWPNDVRIGGRKVAGVLIEAARGAVVVGIGLNVNMTALEFPPDLRDSATSLREVAGRPLDRSGLARRLMERLDELYEGAEGGDLNPIADGWRDRLEGLDRAVRLLTRSGPVAGRLVEADLIGGLRIVLDDGNSRSVPASEILGFEAGSSLAVDEANRPF